MPPFMIRPFSTAALLILVLSVPAAAQESAAKTAWQDLRAFARERGVLIASQGVTDYGSSLIAQNVRIYLQDEPDSMVITMPEMRIEPRGAALAMIPSPEFLVTLHPDRRTEYVLAVTHNGEIIADVSDDRIALDLPFRQLDIRTIRAVRQNIALDHALNLSFTGLDADLELLRAGDADISISADSARYSFAFSQDSTSAPNRQTADAEMTGLSFVFTGHELDMLSDEPGMLRAAFDAGLNAHLRMAVASGSGTSSQVLEGAPITVDSRYGANEMSVTLENGALSLQTTAQNVEFSGGMGPMQGAFALDNIGMALGLPMIATPTDQQIYYRFNLDNLLPSPETLALVGGQAFAGEAITLALDISALGRLTQDFGVDFGDADAPPFDVTSISLNDLRTRVGATEFSGSGAFAFLGGLMNSLGGDMPNGTGDFVFELLGGDALLTRLSAMGIVPADQQFFARMMMNGLGTPIGEDHLRSEVAIRPGGQVTVNGAPLPF